MNPTPDMAHVEAETDTTNATNATNATECALAWRSGSLTMWPAQRQLTLHGQPLALGSRAFDILAALQERIDGFLSLASWLTLNCCCPEHCSLRDLNLS